MTYDVEKFGVLNTEKILLYRIFSDAGYQWAVTNYGGIIHQWYCPDMNGNVDDILLGCGNFQDYLAGHPYFGALVGRYANRIAFGRFKIEGEEYYLAQNLGRHHLHGGLLGFDKKIWKTSVEVQNHEIILSLHYLSPHMDEGYPGNLDVKVWYIFNENGKLTIRYSARTDRPTHLNLTNHCYFNLGGQSAQTILDHIVFIDSDYFLESDHELIPTGKLLAVENSAFDFRTPHSVGERIGVKDPDLIKAAGYDHNYILNRLSEGKHAAAVFHESSGRLLIVNTDQPGVQLYTGNHLEGVKGKNGFYKKFAGLCLETQHFPDSPNQKAFPSTLLLPGQIYNSNTSYSVICSEKIIS